VTGSNAPPDGDAAAAMPSAPVVAWETPVEVTGPAAGLDFAPHGPRFVAYLIDCLIIYALMAIVSVVIFVPWAMLGPTRSDDPTTYRTLAVAGTIWFVVILGIAFGYFPFFWARGGRTPGMRPFRLVIVRDRDGSRIGWRTAILRVVGMFFVSTVFYLGFIWVFVDKRHRAWHDLIAGTLMVRRSDPEG
jgi:uncharacterized RDD family membrane protein YckC